MQFTNNPQGDVTEMRSSFERRSEHSCTVHSNFKLASAVSLTLQVRHSSSNTVADWSGAAGPSLKKTADRGAGVS